MHVQQPVVREQVISERLLRNLGTEIANFRVRRTSLRYDPFGKLGMELCDLKPSDNNNEEDERRDEVADSNGAHCIAVNIPDDLSQEIHSKPVGKCDSLKRELNEKACWKLKVWMLILICFILIALVIFLTVYFCSVYQEDVDEKYDVADFVVPRFFRGNFTLLNQTLTLDTQETQTLLKVKLTQMFTSSYALGRYFTLATVNPLSSSSVEYKLDFMMPEEHKQMVLYTLSKEMVYNVLLQQLYDQDTEDPLYIEPSSLVMEVES